MLESRDPRFTKEHDYLASQRLLLPLLPGLYTKELTLLSARIVSHGYSSTRSKSLSSGERLLLLRPGAFSSALLFYTGGSNIIHPAEREKELLAHARRP